MKAEPLRGSFASAAPDPCHCSPSHHMEPCVKRTNSANQSQRIQNNEEASLIPHFSLFNCVLFRAVLQRQHLLTDYNNVIKLSQRVLRLLKEKVS